MNQIIAYEITKESFNSDKYLAFLQLPNTYSIFKVEYAILGHAKHTELYNCPIGA